MGHIPAIAVRVGCICLGIITLVAMPARSVVAQENADPLGSISLDSLLNVRVQAASKYEQETRFAAASLEIITADEIQRAGYRTLADALNDVAGFYVSYDRTYTYLGVRGFSRPTDYNNRVLVLLNGHRLNEGVYGAAFIGTELGINLGGVERIEVIRGPGSALYGTSAMFAVINLVTKTGADLNSTRVGAEYGSWNSRTAAFEIGNRFADGFDYSILGEWNETDGQDLYISEFDDPATNNGIAEGLDWDMSRSLVSTAKYNGFGLTARYSERNKGLPTASYGTVFNDARGKTRDAWHGVDLTHASQLAANMELRLRASYDSYDYEGVYPSSAVYVAGSTAKGIDAEAQLNWDPAASHRITLGTQVNRFMQADFQFSDGTTSLRGDFPYSVYSAYGQVESHLTTALTVVGGARYDRYTLGFGSATPRLGLILTPNSRTVVKLLWGRAYRAPNIYEHFYADEARWKRNPDLKPETIETWELLAERRIGRYMLAQGSLYHYSVDRLIDTRIDPADSLQFYTNVNNVRATGGELTLLAQATHMQARMSYGYQNALDSETDATVSNSPTHLIKGTFSVSLPAALQVTWMQRYESGRYTVQQTKTAGFTVANTTIRKGNLFDPRATGVLQVRNVFDAQYATPGGIEHTQAAIVQDGRSLAFRIEWQF